MRLNAPLCICALAGAVVSASSPAQAAVIDFESFALAGAPFLDVGSPLLITLPDVAVTIKQGADLRIYDLFQFAGDPATTGQALIDMSWSSFTNPKGTEILFDHDVSNFSLNAGDFGSDDDSPLRIEAFDESGASLGVATAFWPASASGSFATLSLPVSGIRRVHYSSGGDFPSSTFIDNVTFTVPAPASLIILAGALTLRRRPRD